MPQALNSLRELLVHELQDLYSAETQLVDALPLLAEAATSVKLKKGFTEHLAQTKKHVSRLEQCFKQLGETPGGEVCAAMKGIITEGQKLLKQKAKADPAVFDAALICAAQRAEHYEIAAYGCVCAFCRQLCEDGCLQLLQQTLNEEADTDRLLSQLALDEINRKAQPMEASASAM
jgi:ferritin-like metal-binding protein YciE